MRHADGVDHHCRLDFADQANEVKDAAFADNDLHFVDNQMLKSGENESSIISLAELAGALLKRSEL
ncbi:hypothetical protein AM571_CH03727 [Rhizobium etli 8C-3]|uniref:Uncharacterized protein n=2 Tax=Rhizobium TaxID=379 RepID=A0A1L5P8M8_RHIET|nr:hypothetical protein [Rhizobium etli]APO76511.1 hypothetical protein AM571_CH03727 [Rhizobium etli 8C-3]